MTSLTKVTDELRRINLTLASQPKSNPTIQSNSTIYDNATLSDAFTFSDAIDLKESGSLRNFRNVTFFGNTTTAPTSVKIHIAISQDNSTYFVLPPNASMVLHQTGGSVYDWHISLTNVGARYVKLYVDRPVASFTAIHSATD